MTGGAPRRNSSAILNKIPAARHIRQIAALALLLALVGLGCKNIDEAAFDEGMTAYTQGDFKTAMDKWKPLAEGGNPSAQTNIGVMYYQGRGVKQDYKEAIRWYSMAAANGYPDAEYNLGLAFAEGKGVEASNEQALKWYKASAEGGYLTAQVLLGNVYSHGQGVPKDEKEAVRWYQMAADQGDSTSQFLLATAYLKGAGVDKDDVRAYMWLAVAAQQGDDEAKTNANSALRQLSQRMTPDQIGKGEQMAKDQITAHPRLGK